MGVIDIDVAVLRSIPAVFFLTAPQRKSSLIGFAAAVKHSAGIKPLSIFDGVATSIVAEVFIGVADFKYQLRMLP